jgi:two-component system phosphate regulon response regulator PhoB
MSKIVVISKNQKKSEAARVVLAEVGYEATVADSGKHWLNRLPEFPPEAILLDVAGCGMVPDKFCRELKDHSALQQAALLLLGGTGQEEAIAACLMNGADDYINGVEDGELLAARVARIIAKRQAGAQKQQRLNIQDLAIDPGKREVLLKNKKLELTFTEFQILYSLVAKPGWVFTREEIMNAVRGENYPATARSIDVQIVGLRKKLGGMGRCIETVRGVGYRFRAQ